MNNQPAKTGTICMLLEDVLLQEVLVLQKSLYIDSLINNELNAIEAFKSLESAIVRYRNSGEHIHLMTVKREAMKARYYMNAIFIGYNHENDLVKELPAFLKEKEQELQERYEAQERLKSPGEW